MSERLTTTQEEMLSTLRRIGEPATLVDVIRDVRERVMDGDAHRFTATETRQLGIEWDRLAQMGRVRRVSAKQDSDDYLKWELVPRVEIVDDENEDHKTSEEH